MTISNVRGLNDNATLNKPATFAGTCATCHDAPNIGHHSLPLPLDIGTVHTCVASFEPDTVVAEAVGQSSTPDLPIFLISGCPNPFNAGQAERSTEPIQGAPSLPGTVPISTASRGQFCAASQHRTSTMCRSEPA